MGGLERFQKFCSHNAVPDWSEARTTQCLLPLRHGVGKFLRPREREKVPIGRLRVVRMRTNPVAGVRWCQDSEGDYFYGYTFI